MRSTISAIAISSVCLCVVGYEAAAQVKESELTELQKSAKQFIEYMEKGKFEKATKDYDEAMKKAMPADKLDETWKKVLSQVGSFKKQTAYRTVKIKEYDAVLVTCEFENQTLDIRVVYNSKKQVSGLQFLPSK